MNPGRYNDETQEELSRKDKRFLVLFITSLVSRPILFAEYLRLV